MLRGFVSGPGRHCACVAFATTAFGNGSVDMIVNSSHNNIAASRIEFRWNPASNASAQTLQVRTAGNVSGNVNTARVSVMSLPG